MSCSQSSDCENPTEDGALIGSENSALNSLNEETSHESVDELSDKQMESQESKTEDEERILVDSERENETGDNVSVTANNKMENDDSSSKVSKIEVASNIVVDESDLAEEECNVDRADTNESTTFRRPKRSYFNRIYRTQRSDGNSSPDELDDSTRRSSSGPTSVSEPRNTENTGPGSGSVGGGNGLGGEWENFSLSSSSSSSSSSSLLSQVDSPDAEMIDEKDITNLPRVFSKPKPRHKWFIVQEAINRQLGVSSRWLGPELFQQRCYGSLHAVQRLELMYKLEAHEGCVNALNFNPSGSLLATASDDRKVALWDWALGKCVFTYDSGHSSNVFQAKFLPLSGDRHIVSCARDGQIRLAVLSCTGVCLSTRQLAVHRRPAHKIATQPETPHVFLSAAEDAVVMSLDVREHNHNKLLICKEGTEKIALYSIHSNPINCHEFCVTGDDHYIRLYDKRKISEGNCLKKFCPQHLVKSEVFIHVTCAVFNYNGTEILGSFNDEDIYLFDTRHSDGADYVHRYEGHRNSVTVKGVNFFGPRSEYIVSGSDCGNIFFWDKHTESIVQWMRGDEEGVVNCLEPHPQVPMIATSGLDHDVKIWVPSCEQEPTFEGLKSAVIFNQKARDENRSRRGDPWDSQMQWLWRQIRRFERRRGNPSEARQETRTQGEGDTAPATGASEESSASTEEDEQVGRPECSPS